MKKKSLLFGLLMLMSIGVVDATNYDGIYVITPDGQTSYQLSSVPHINYTEVNGVKVAQLLLGNETNPVVTVELKDGQTLSAFYATYEPTSINSVQSDQVTTYTKNGRKYITGGKLIIIGTDGKKYDMSGKEIK